MESYKFKNWKKGTIVEIEYHSVMSDGKRNFLVSSRNKVLKGKVDKITMRSASNPKGVKYYIYIRDNKGYMAMGDMGVHIKKVKVISY